MNKYSLFLILILFSSFAMGQVARELHVETTHEIRQEDKDEQLEKYYELSTEPGLSARGAHTVYRGQNLGAIQFPVGGIGTGCIQFDGQAVPRYWQIFNNMGHDFIPNSFFAVRVKNKKNTEVRALQTKNVGAFEAMSSLEAVSQFPFMQYEFQDDLPARIRMQVYNPFVPADMKSSGVPAVFYEFTVENPTEEDLEISLLSSQQNAVGFSRLPLINHDKSFADNYQFSINRKPVEGNASVHYGGNFNSVAQEEGSIVLWMEGSEDKTHEHFGQMALAVLQESTDDEVKVEGAASWADEKELYDRFLNKGSIRQTKNTSKSKPGTTWSGALNVKFTLKPGEQRKIKMVLAWYFPNGKNGGYMDKWDAWGHGDWEGNGNQYASHWSDIRELMRYIRSDHDRLYHETKTFTDALYSTNLPYWLTERIANQLNILKSRTVFHDKDGFIGLWEGTGGVDGSCAGNCNHVWHYAQSHARLFPAMGRAIRSQAFDAIKEDGQLPYRLPAGSFAFDGQCGEILGAYREYLLSVNKNWLEKHYPAIKKATNYLIAQHDSDRDGWLSDKPKHTTYDASMTGNPSFLSSLYLAALRAAVRMATETGDTQQAGEWSEIATSSAKLQQQRLWNGEYFIQIPGEKRATDYELGCHADQLLGQWWADQLGLGSLYPDWKIKSATEAVLKYNFMSTLKKHNQGHRTFALPEEAGMVATTWPISQRPKYASGYSSEVWSTFEYTIGASLMKYEEIKDALVILRAGYKRYDGKLRTGYIGDWGNFGFSGNPFGDDECGQFYGRALSVWSVLLAAQGYHYHGPSGIIGFAPKWNPQDHHSFFSAAQGWGVFSQERTNGKQVNTIELKYGKLRLTQVNLQGEMGKESDVELLINDKPQRIEVSQNGNRYQMVFDSTVLKAGDQLVVNIN